MKNKKNTTKIFMQFEKPPNTTRYCVLCEKNQSFEYDKNLGHSKCSVCGSRFGAMGKFGAKQ